MTPWDTEQDVNLVVDEEVGSHMSVAKEITNFEEGEGFKTGDTIDYQVTVANDGFVDQQDVTVTDVIEGSDISKELTNIKVVSDVNGEITDFDVTGNTITFDTLGAQETLTITYSIQANDEFVELGTDKETVTNTVTVDVAENNDGDDVNTTIEGNGATTSINKDVNGSSEVTYTKSVTDKNDDIAQAGETLYYTITAENTGGVEESSLTIFDYIDTDLLDVDTVENLSYTLDGDSDFSDGIVNKTESMIYFTSSTGTLAVGDKLTLTFSIDVKDTLVLDPTETEMTIVNEVSGDTSFSETDLNDIQARAEIPVGLANDMNPVVTKSLVSTEDGNDLVKQDEELYYQVVVDNTASNVNIPNLVVTDRVDEAENNVVGNISAVKVTNSSDEVLTVDTDYTVDGNDITIINALPGEVYTITYTMQTVSEFTDTGYLVNAAVLNSENFFTYGDNNDDYNSVYLAEKDVEAINSLDVQKTVSDTSDDDKEMAEAGEQLNYEITITNDGGITQDHVVFRDSLADSDFDLSTVTITSVEHSETGAIEVTDSDFTDGIQIFLDHIAPGDSVTIKFSVNVKEENLGGRLFRFVNAYVENTATVTSDYYKDGIEAEADIELDQTADGMAEFNVEKELVRTSDADVLADPGELITYKVTVENTGSLDQPNFTLADTPDVDEVTGNIDLTSVQIDGVDTTAYTVTPNTIVFNNIPSGSTVEVTYAVMTAGAFVDNTDFTNEVAYYGDNVPTDMEDSKSVSIPKDIKNASQLTVEKTVTDADGNGLAEVGESLSYQISIENTGRVNLTNVSVVDSLDDPNFNLDTLTNPVVTSDVNGNVDVTNDSGIDLVVPSIAVGETITITFSVDVKSTNLSSNLYEAITNEVVVTNGLESSDENYEEYTGKESIDINYDEESVINFTVAKEFVNDSIDNGSEDLADVNEDLSYRVTVENTGKTDFSNIQILDALDNDEVIDGFTITTITVDGEELTVDTDYTINESLDGIELNSLPAGSKLVVEYDVTTESAFVNSLPIVNTVRVIPQGVTGKLDVVSIPKNLEELNSIEFTKEVSEANNNKASAGETLDYTITFTNNGDIVQNNVVITDAISDSNLVASSLANISVVSSENGTLGVTNDAALGLELAVGDVQPGETITVTFTVNVKETGIDTNFLRFTTSYIENIASATSNNMSSLDIDNVQDDARIEIDIDDPEMSNLQVSKVLTATSVGDDLLADVEDTLSYTITLDNSESKMSMNNVVVTDLIDENINEDGITNLKIVDSEGNEVAYTEDFISIIFDEIPAGETYTITYDTTTVSVFDNKEPVINSLSVTSDNMPTDYEKALPVDKVMPEEEDLTLEKSVVDASGNDKAHFGETLTYTVTVSNNSDYNEYDVLLTDKIDDINLNRSTATMVSAESSVHGDFTSGINAIGTEQILIDELQAGEVLTFVYSVNVKTNAIARTTSEYIENEVLLENDYYDGVTAPIKEATDQIEIDKSHEGMSELDVKKELISTSDEDMLVDPSETLTYRVTLDNSNSAMHQDNVVIVDTPDSDDMASTIANVKLTDGTNEVDGMTVTGNTIEIDQIPSGETYYLEYTIDTNSSFADTTKATNGLKVTGDDIPTDEEWNFTISDPKDITGNTEYTLEKSAHGADGADDTLVTAGEEITYTITLENTGTTGIGNIEIIDALSDTNLDRSTINSVTVNDEDATVTSDGKIIVNLDNLAPGETLEISFKINVVTTNIARLSTSHIVNTVDLTSTNAEDEATAELELDKKAEGMSELAVTKSLVKSEKGESTLADTSEVLTYQLVLANTGSIDQNNVVVTDTPDSVDTVGAISNVTITNSSDEEVTDFTVEGNVISIDKIASNETYTVTYEVTTKSNFADTTDVTNNVTVTGDDVYDRENDDDTLEDSVDVPKDIASNSSVAITKTSVDGLGDNGKVIAGEKVDYTITVTNDGTMPLYDLVVADDLADSNFDLSSATINSITSDVTGEIENTDTDLTNGFAMTFDEVAVGETITIKLSVSIKATNLSRLTTDYVENTATVSNETNKVSDSAEDKLEIDKTAEGMSELTIDKSLVSIASGDDKVVTDDTITYQIVLNNTLSSMDMTNVLVVDSIDSEDTTGIITLVSLKDQDGNDITGYSVEGSTMTIDNIPAGDTFTITYSVKTASTFADDSDIVNTVNVSGDDVIESLTDDETVAKDVEKLNDLTVEKSAHGEGGADDLDIEAGELVSYTIKVTNTGTIDQTNVSIYDAIIDSNLDFMTLNNIVFTHADGSQEDGENDRVKGALYELDVLHPGETVYLTFEINALESGISTADSTKITNIGNVTTDYYNDTDVVKKSDEFELDIDTSAESMNAITPTKTVVGTASGNNLAGTNEVISYQIVLDNNEGLMDLEDVRVEDTVDSDDIVRDSFHNLKIVLTSKSGKETELDSSDYTAGTNYVSIHDVPSESTVTITYDVTTAGRFADDTDITNEVTLTAGNTTGEKTDDATISKDVDAISKLTISKDVADSTTDNRDAAEAGERLDYTITVTNSGSMTATNINVVDSLDDTNLDPTSVDNLQVKVNDTNVPYTGQLDEEGLNITGESLAVGQTVVITFSVNVKSSNLSTLLRDSIDNTVTVSSDYTDSQSDDASIPLDKQADGMISYDLTKKLLETGDKDMLADNDEALTYEVRFKNTGNIDLTNVTLVDDPDVEDAVSTIALSEVSLDGDALAETEYTLSGNTLTIPAVNKGQEVVVKYVITTKDHFTDSTDVVNKVTANSDEMDDSHSRSVKAETPKDIEELNDVIFTKEVHGDGGETDQLAEAGETLTYTVTMTNNGSIDQMDVNIYDAFEDRNLDTDSFNLVSIVSSEDTDLSAVTDGTEDGLDIVIPRIVVGETVTITFTVDVVETGIGRLARLVTSTIDNSVKATSEYTEISNIVDYIQADAKIEIDTTNPEMSNLTGTKELIETSSNTTDSEGELIVRAGETLTYQITLDNTNSKVNQDSLVINDAPDSGDTVNSISNVEIIDVTNSTTLVLDEDYTVSGNKITIDSMPAGTKYTVTYTVDALDEFTDMSPVDNKAYITGEDVYDQVEEDDTLSLEDSANKDLAYGNSMKVEKSVVDDGGQGSATSGEYLSYTIKLTNDGTIRQSNVEVLDTLEDEYLFRETASNLNVSSSTRGELDIVDDLTDGVNFTIDTIDVGETITITFDIRMIGIVTTMKSTRAVQEEIMNTVFVSSDYFGTGDVDGLSDDASIPIDRTAEGMNELFATKKLIDTTDTATDSNESEVPLVDTDEELTYEIVVDNTAGTIRHTNVILQDTPDSDDTTGNIYDVVVTDNEGNALTEDVDYEVNDNEIIIYNVPAAELNTVTYKIRSSETFADKTNVENSVRVSSDEIPVEEQEEVIAEGKKDVEGNIAGTFTKEVHGADGVDDNLAEAGETLTYTITLSNTGSIEINDMVVTDDISDKNLDKATAGNLVVTSSTRGELDITDNLTDGLSLTIDKIASGEVITIEFTVDVVSTGVRSLKTEYITNTATGNDDYFGHTEDELSDDAQIQIDKEATGMNNLTIEKSLLTDTDEDGFADPSETLTYQVVFNNSTSSMNMDNVVFTDTPDSVDTNGAITFISLVDKAGNAVATSDEDEAGYSIDGNELTIGSIPSGEVYTFTYSVQTNDTFTDLSKVTNAYVATSDDFADTMEDTAEVEKDASSNSSLTVIKDVEETDADAEATNGKAEAGEQLTYTITVNNTGDIALENVNLVDNLSDTNLNKESAVITSITINGTEVELTEDMSDGMDLTIPTLAVGEELIITFNVNVINTNLTRYTRSFINNDVTVTTDNGVSDSDDSTIEIDKEAEGMSSLDVTKDLLETTDGDMLADSNEWLTYKVTVTNDGKITQNNVQLVDIPDAISTKENVELISVVDQDGDTVSTDEYEHEDKNFTIYEMASDDVVTITYRVQTKESFENPNSVRNFVQYSGDDLVSDGTASELVPKDLTESNNVEFTKEVQGSEGEGDDLAVADETLTYTFTIKNTGSIDQRRATIGDQFTDANLDRSSITNLSVVDQDGRSMDYEVDYTDGFDILIVDRISAGDSAIVSFDIKAEDIIDTSSKDTIDNSALYGSTYYGVTEDYLSDDATINIDKASMDNLVLTKETVTTDDGNTLVIPGETISYKLTVDNSATAMNLDDVVITDVPSTVDTNGAITNIKIVATNESGSSELTLDSDYTVEGNVISFDQILGKTTYEITYDVVANSTFDNANDVVNTATLTSEDIETEETEEQTEKDLASSNELKVNKSVEGAVYDDGLADAGELLQYTVTLENTGSIDQLNVAVQDPLDDVNLNESTAVMIDIVSSTRGDITEDSFNEDHRGYVFFDRISVGETITITFDVNVSSTVNTVDSDFIQNIVTVTSDYYGQGDVEAIEAPAEIEIDKETMNTFKISKSLVDDSDGDGLADPNETLTYEVVFDNSESPMAHDNVVITDIPDQIDTNGGITIESVKLGEANLTNGADYTTTSNSININHVPAGEKVTIRYTVQTNERFINRTDVTNLVRVTGEDITENFEQNFTYPVIKDIENSLDGTAHKEVSDNDGNGKVAAGEELTYTISFTNTGSIDHINAVISDLDLDENLDTSTINITSITSTEGRDLSAITNEVTDGVQVTIPRVIPGETVTVEFTVNVKSTGVKRLLRFIPSYVTNTALVTSDGTDSLEETGYESNETSLPIDYEAEGMSNMTAEKQLVSTSYGDVDTAVTHETLYYEITLDNSDASMDQDNVVIEDTPDSVDTAGVITEGSVKIYADSIEITDGYSVDGNTITIDKIPAGSVYTIAYEVETNDTFTDMSNIDNSVVITGDDVYDTVNKDNQLEAETSTPKDLETLSGLQIYKSVVDNGTDSSEPNGKAEAGEELTYTIRLANESTMDQTNVVLYDDIFDTNIDSSSVEIVSVVSARYGELENTDDASVDGIEMTFDRIEAGEDIVITFTANVIDSGLSGNACMLRSTTTECIYNEAYAGSDYYGNYTDFGPYGDAEIEIDKEAEGMSSLLVNKELVTTTDSETDESEATTSLADPSETLSYKVTLENNGSIDQNQLVITDVIDSVDVNNTIRNVKLTNQDGTDITSSVTIDGNEISIDKIASGDTVTITYDVITNSSFTNMDSIDNTIQVTGNDVIDPEDSDNLIESSVSVDKDLVNNSNL